MHSKCSYLKRVYCGLVFVSLILCSSLSFAAVSGVEGNIVTGQLVTIRGSGFGSNTINYEWLGTNIESGTAGEPFSKAGWINGQSYSDSVYAKDQAHSGTQSLKSGPYNDRSAYGGDLRFNGQKVGVNTDLYMSWWVRRNVSGTGQWKMLRISEINDVVDHPYEQVWFNWNNSYGQQIFTRTSSTDCTQGNGTCDYGAKFPTRNDVWYRIDFYMHTSNAGVADGSYTQILYTPGSTRLSDSKTGITNWGVSGHSYPWYIFQNWVGNGVTSQTHWMDDIYIQSGSQARVELCDTSAWSSRTSCDIQPATNWLDTSISVTVNTGGFTSGETVYLYVVGANGDVNSKGYPVIISGSGGTSQVVEPSPQLRIGK